MASHIQESHHPYAKQHACMHATYGETESSGFPSPHQKQHQVNIKKTTTNIQMPKTLSTHHLVYLMRAQINLPNLTNTKKKGTLSSRASTMSLAHVLAVVEARASTMKRAI
jgi:hypothetical protein